MPGYHVQACSCSRAWQQASCYQVAAGSQCRSHILHRQHNGRHATQHSQACVAHNTHCACAGNKAVMCDLQVVIFNSTLAQNSAADGGGIYAGQGTRLSIFNSNLTANQAAKSGAALVLAAQSCAAVQSCTFSRNNATGGGGISCEGCKVRLDRTTFSNNTAVQYGGGLEAVKSAHVSSGVLVLLISLLQTATDSQCLRDLRAMCNA